LNNTIYLFRWGLGLAAAEQVEDLDQTRSKDNDHEEGDEGGADAWTVLVALGDLAGVDVTPLGDILVEFAVSVADVSGKRLYVVCVCDCVCFGETRVKNKTVESE
jgi:hypothetical protein